MNFAETFMGGYEGILHLVAEITIITLELIGILIILIGAYKSIIRLFLNLRHTPHKTNIIIDLGKALALALEFKMGAEIVKTVIVRDLKELGILAIVIIIRAALAVLIHWEMKNERKAEAEEALEKKETEN
jgi:uncharacterized membrane protein